MRVSLDLSFVKILIQSMFRLWQVQLIPDFSINVKIMKD